MIVKNEKIEKIKPYKNNPRKNAAAVKQVAESISQYGFQQPIVVDKKHVIIVGHTRYFAAKDLGLKTVPVVVADKLTPKQVKAYRIADNKTHEYSDWDFELLKDELEGLGDLDEYFTGFNDMELHDILEPDFKPDDQGKTRLDEKKKVVCPECGYEFEN